MAHDPAPKINRLEIRAFRTRVHLGVTQEERAIAQEVEFDVLVEFVEEPSATQTDQLEDTLCYDVLCQGIETTCSAHPFQLIEALGRAVYDALRYSSRHPEIALQIKVHKLKTPIAGLHGGAWFTYGDALR